MSGTRGTVTPASPHDGAVRDAGVVGFIRRRPLTTYLLWFFTVGMMFSFTPVVARAYGVDLQPAQLFTIASTLFGLLLPAVVITRIVDGPTAVRALWRRSIAAWVSLRWYALALIAVPLVAIALAIVVSGAPTVDLTASTVLSAVVFGLLLQTVVALVPNNWAEEVAWTGFFQARLQERSTVMRAALTTAPLFALQHVAGLVGLPLTLGIGLLVFLTIVSIPGRALMAWTYNRTGSLFMVGFLHAAGNGAAGNSGFGYGFLPRLYPDDPYVGFLHLVAWAVVGLIVIVATRARLGSPHRRFAVPSTSAS